MGAWLDRLALFWLDATVASAALLVVVTLMMVACHQPARRSFLARGAILGVLALPGLIGFAPIPRIEAARHLGRFALPRPPIDGDEEGPRHPAPGPRRPWLPDLLLAAYGIGAISGLSRLGLGYWGLGRLLKTSAGPSAASQALLDDLARSRRRPPGLRVSARVGQPVVVGLLRPTIVIPPGLDRPESAAALRLSLLHELAHADRLDLLFNLLAEIARDVWFFLPPVWWLRAQLRLDQEFLADGGAAFGFGSSGLYASSLVALADPRAPGGPTRPGATDPAARGSVSALFLRVLMLVRCPFPMEPKPPIWWRGLMFCLLTTLTLGSSAVTLRSPDPGPPRPPAGPFTFAVPSLLIDAGPPGPNSRCVAHNLPLRLPRRFDLSVEILASPADLGKIRVAGLPIAPACDDCREPETWHLVQIRRQRDRIEVRLDDQPPSPVRHDGPPPPWLSIDTPAGTKLPLRNLSVRW